MQITYNGQSINIAENMSIEQFLTEQKLDPAKVVVERNKNIVLSADFGSTILQADDILEVLHFVGGG